RADERRAVPQQLRRARLPGGAAETFRGAGPAEDDSRAGGLARKRDREEGAGAGRALERHGAAEGVDELLHGPEAEAEAADVRVAGEAFERAEEPRAVGGGDADALVAHREPDRFLGAVDLDVDGAAGAVLHRVRDEVGDDDLDAQAVPVSIGDAAAREAADAA